MCNLKLLADIILLSVLVFAQGCSNTFSRIDFIHGSQSYVSYRDAMVEVNGNTDVVVTKLTDIFRINGFSVVERAKLDWYPVIQDENQKCWAAMKEMYDGLADAFNNNSYSEYKKFIDDNKICEKHGFRRKGQLVCDCEQFKEEKTTRSSYFMEMDSGERTSSALTANFNIISAGGSAGDLIGIEESKSTTLLPFLSRTRIWIWQDKNMRNTKIMLESRPMEAKTRTEAKIGNSIGHDWWNDVKGMRETDLVKSLKLLIEDLNAKNFFYQP